MKILVFSDSHGELRYMEKAVFDESPDIIIHLGDKIRDSEKLQEKFCRIPFISVPGNCDMGSILQPIRIEEISGVRFFITHGHIHAVKMGMLRYRLAAEEAGVQVALYGHTHVAAYEKAGDIHMMNPGAAGGGYPSYGVVEIDTCGGISCRIVKL